MFEREYALERLADRKGYFLTHKRDEGYTLNKLDQHGAPTDNDVLTGVSYSETEQFLRRQSNVSYGEIDGSASTVGDSFFR